MKTLVIYGLSDPRTGALRYIGRASNLRKRVFRHLHPLKHERALGLRHTDEARKRMSEQRTGRKLSPATLAKRRRTIAKRLGAEIA